MQRAQKKGMAVCEGKCSSFELNTPYYLWNTFFKSLLSIGTETPETEIRLRLHDTLQILALEVEEPYLATLLSLRYEEILMEVDADRRRKIFEATSKLLLAFASRRPSLFVFEDLHWIDRFSQELLEFVFAQETLAPALFCCLFRAEYTQAKKIMDKSELLDLDRLPEDEAKELMRSRLGAQSVPDALVQLMDKRAEGNPFFIEEIVKTLLDRRVVAVKKGKVEILAENLEAGVPETLQGVILARIDQLEGRIREVLLDASVIGREFSRPVLENVVEKKIDVPSGLDALEALELILEREAAQEFQYLFKHYLIQEVAYNTILVQKRKKLHGLIAQAIERLYADKLKKFYELLAFHYEKAENWEKAAEYLSRAGRKVGEIFSKEESKDFAVRKDKAIEQLYASGKAVRGLAGIFSGLFGLLLICWCVALLILWIDEVTFQFTGTRLLQLLHGSRHLRSKPEVWLTVLGFTLWIAFLLYLSVRASRLFLRNVPHLYEVLDDQVKVHFSRSKVLSVPFGDIALIGYFENLKPSGLGILGSIRWRWNQRNTYPMLLKSCIQAIDLQSWFLFRKRSDGRTERSHWIDGIIQPERLLVTPAEGEIHLRRKSGSRKFWFTLSIMDKREIALTPSNPKEFFKQLEIALKKWKIRNAVPLIKQREAISGNEQPVFRLRPKLLPPFSTVGPFSLALLLCVLSATMLVTMGYGAWQIRHTLLTPFLYLAAFIYLALPFYKTALARKNMVSFYSKVEYQIYRDRIEYGFPGTDWRTLSFGNILGYELMQKRAQKKFNTGTIRINSNKAVVQVGANLRTSEYFVDIENAVEIHAELSALLKDFRERV